MHCPCLGPNLLPSGSLQLSAPGGSIASELHGHLHSHAHGYTHRHMPVRMFHAHARTHTIN